MIGIDTALRLHELSINKYGGLHGIRDEGLLEALWQGHIKHLAEKIYILPFLKKQQPLRKAS